MPRLLLLFPTTTYRTRAFLDAAHRLGLDVTVASEQPSTVERLNPAGLVTLDFNNPDRAAEQAADFAARHPIHAVVPVDDQATLPAAAVAARLGLPGNPPDAIAAAQNKYLLRCRLRDHAVPSPEFQLCSLDDDPAELARRVNYPCVLKPLALSASRGVIRADNPHAFTTAAGRLTKILHSEYHNTHHSSLITHHFLVDSFIPGPEVALEGLLTRGRLHTLALFDKPDPLDGPYFEETILLTPSRLPESTQHHVAAVTQSAVHALGLLHGPIHAELRLAAARGLAPTPTLIELNPRSIGGLCSRVLRFVPNDSPLPPRGGELGWGAAPQPIVDISLEELILRHALNPDFTPPPLQPGAAAVMMIPIPRAGTLESVEGLEAAKAVPYIEDAVISAHRGQQLAPLPEAGIYLGFLFARAPTPPAAESALRTAHAQLTFHIHDVPHSH